ncbi:MAG: hypothetical protein HKN03_11240 [Acidimicrobiales bacterium]|nr:hypothetical protein [Acidimicrobiales bacterium]
MSSRPSPHSRRSVFGGRFVYGALVLAFLAAACTGAGDQVGGAETENGASVLGTTTVPDPEPEPEPEPAEETTTTETPPELNGSLVVTGSNTVEPITAAVIEGYRERQPDVLITMAGTGTGAGFDDLCNDPSISIVGASRPINGSESASCLSSGVQPIELRLARDGIAIVVHNASALQCLTYTDLYALAGPESTGLTTLEAVGTLAAELGSTTAWGTGDVALVAPGPTSGTAGLFADEVIEPIALSRGVGKFFRVDNRSLDSNAQLVDAVATDPAAVGIVGSSFASRSSTAVRMLGVSDGAGCVIPNDAAVVAGLYPLSRDLYLYVDGASEDPIVADFVYYYLNVALRDAVAAAEYVVLSAAEQAESVARWTNR